MTIPSLSCETRRGLEDGHHPEQLRRVAPRLGAAFQDEDLALRIELALLMVPQQVRQNEVMLEEGEITCEVYVVLHGCLEATCGEAPEMSPASWVARCLEQETCEVTSEVGSEGEVEVRCGLFGPGTWWATSLQRPSRPLEVRLGVGVQRCATQ